MSQRTPETEADMNSRVTSIFITYLFLAVNAHNTVLTVAEAERNMFYRHKAALMYVLAGLAYRKLCLLHIVLQDL